MLLVMIQDQILGNGKATDTAVLLTVLRDEPEAGVNGLPRCQPGQSPAVKLDSSLDDPCQAEQCLGQLGLAIALDAGDAHDFSAVHLKIKIVYSERPVRPGYENTFNR